MSAGLAPNEPCKCFALRLASLAVMPSQTLLVVLLSSLQVSAAFAAWPEPLDFWLANDSSSEESVDHSLFSNFLSVAVVHDNQRHMNLVRYSSLASADKALLAAYLQQMQATDPRTLNRDEQMAYWINLYNALTVQVVLDHPDKQTIKDMGQGWFSRGPWSDELVKIAGQELSLDDIEHRILRAIWQDRRIHFAVNCASLGCPELAASPYEAADLDDQLDQAEYNFISHPRALTVNGDELILSSIFNWYAEDFAPDRQQLLSYLAGSSGAAETRMTVASWSGPVRYTYDWSLNAQLD